MVMFLERILESILESIKVPNRVVDLSSNRGSMMMTTMALTAIAVVSALTVTDSINGNIKQRYGVQTRLAEANFRRSLEVMLSSMEVCSNALGRGYSGGVGVTDILANTFNPDAPGALAQGAVGATAPFGVDVVFRSPGSGNGVYFQTWAGTYQAAAAAQEAAAAFGPDFTRYIPFQGGLLRRMYLQKLSDWPIPGAITPVLCDYSQNYYPPYPPPPLPIIPGGCINVPVAPVPAVGPPVTQRIMRGRLVMEIENTVASGNNAYGNSLIIENFDMTIASEQLTADPTSAWKIAFCSYNGGRDFNTGYSSTTNCRTVTGPTLPLNTNPGLADGSQCPDGEYVAAVQNVAAGAVTPTVTCCRVMR